MISRYVWRDLVRNPRRSLSALAGIVLGVGLFSAVLFFIDGSSASMTARAVAPLPLDMQRVLSDPLGNQVRLTERITPTRLQAGEIGHVQLELANRSARPANEVVIRDEPPEPLHYVPGSTTVDGVRLPDPGGDSPLAQGEAKLGLNLGTVAARTTVTVAYEVKAGSAVDSVSTLELGATFSSREIPTPAPANASEPLSLADLTERIAPDTRGGPRRPAFSGRSGPGRAAVGHPAVPRTPCGCSASTRPTARRDPSIRIVDGSYKPVMAC